jgi:predicted dehydrogenase
MKQVGVGIIGTGAIASGGHAPAINAVEETSLVAVLSRDEKRGQDFAQEHNASNAKVHTSLDSFVHDSAIDVAIICSPDALHAEQAKACLQAGKHVLLEKPMTLNVKEAEELIRLAEPKKLVLAVGFHLRSHEGLRALHQQVVQGEIGKLRHIRAIWAFSQYDDSNWRAKEDLAKWWSLSAVGSHCIDLTRWFAQDTDDWEQFAVTIANNVWDGRHDETAVIAAQFASGPTIEITSSVQFGPYNRLELFGDKGQAICEDVMGRAGAGEIRVNGELLSFEAVSPFEKELENLVECIKTGESPTADGAVGLRSLKDLLLASDD